MRFPLSISLALAIAAPGSAGVDKCTLDGLTGGCKGFGENDPPLRTLKDGTLIPNYAAILKKKSALESAKENNESSVKIAERVTATGKAVSQVLNKYGSNLSADIHMSLLQYPLIDWKGIVEGKELDFDTIVSWPLTESDAKSQVVKRRAVREALEKALGPAGFMALKDAYALWPTVEKATQDANDPVQARLFNVTDERKKHVEGLLARTKQLLIAEIRQNRRDADLSPAERRAIQKIEVIKVTPYDKLKSEAACAGPVSQAFFNPLDHSINVCPNFYNFPDATIVSVIGHEMGHVVDACNSQMGVFAIHSDKVNALKSTKSGEVSNDEAINKDAKKSEVFNFLRYASGRNISPSSLPLELMWSPDAIQYMKDKGCIEETVAGTPLDAYFLKDSYDCLITNRKFQSTKDMSKLVDKIVQVRAREQRDGYTTTAGRDANRKKLLGAFGKHPECLPGNDKSEMGEVMADYLGSRVLGEFVKGQKPSNADEEVASVSFFASLACMDKAKGKSKTGGEESAHDILEGAYADARKLYDPHPIAIERLEKVFLADAEVRKNLGCTKLTADQSCEHDYRKVKPAPVPSQASPGAGKNTKGAT